MPHRAGYFVLAYQWDHHCKELVESLKARFAALLGDVESLAVPQRVTPKSLVGFFSAWQALRARLDAHLSEMEKRCSVVNELGNRGYGTNKDLARALDPLRGEHRESAELALRQKFIEAAEFLPKKMPGREEARARFDAAAVLQALGGRGKSEPGSDADPTKAAFARYFAVMSKTPWSVNTTLFQTLFLNMGASSMTIMRGKVGLESHRPPQEVKSIGNRNFLDMYRESFASLHLFSEISLDLIKRIHWVLSKDLVSNAGNFRTNDFPDRNGVTTEYGNLGREIGALAKVLEQAGQSFHDLPRFLQDLSRSYYMFIGIHPFWDSNGRVGRTFLNHMLLKKGLPPVSFTDDEIFALPRYGGSMEAMHAYLTGRVLRAMDAYLREREKLEKQGLLGKEIFNVSFDSGFHFRQINEEPQRLEVTTLAYVVPDGAPLAAKLADECRVTLPSEEQVRSGGLYVGLTDSARGEWKRTLGMVKPASMEEVPSELSGARTFELTFSIALDEPIGPQEWLYCSFVSPEDKRVFANKGIYFGTRIERRNFGGLLTSEAAERWALPAFKWLGARRMIRRAPKGEVAQYPGGIGFSFLGGTSGMALKVLLEIWRADGACERFLVDVHGAGGWGGQWQKWETHQLPLFPWDGAHGHVTFVSFGYLLHRDGRAHVSQHMYKYANFADLTAVQIERDDFYDAAYKSDNRYRVDQVERGALQRAYKAINNPKKPLDVKVIFTRGNPGSPEHPIHEIHRAIDWVIARKKKDKQGRHTIHLAIFDFDNYHVAEHLIWAKKNGVEVECIADWAAVSPVNPTDNVARMRRAGIPVLGVVRNTPGVPSEGIGSMHTKFIIFDGRIVHSSSYNLHFHLWGGNREETLVFRSRPVALLFENVFQAIRGGVVQPMAIDPGARFNLYYSFGYTTTKEGKLFRAQDAIITEINNARSSIDVCMFDIGFLKGVSLQDDFETDVVTALVNARNRGVKVKVLLNGQIGHTGPLPATWDKNFRRPLKDAARRLKEARVDVCFVYYWESIYSPLHHKFASIDGRTALIGSYNWYEASVISDEILLVLRDEGLARTLADEIRQIEGGLRIRRD